MRAESYIALGFMLTTAVVFLLVGIWDVYQVGVGEPDRTISAVIKQWGAVYPILPYMFGFLVGLIIGHVFW